MDREFDSSTEYKTSYTWKNKPPEATMDKYEEAVERMMQAQYISFTPDLTRTKQEEDPYEMIVRRKMNEPVPEEYNQQQPGQALNDSRSGKSLGSNHSHHYEQQQYQDRRDNYGSGANSVSSRSSSRSSKSRHSDIGSFQDINDNMSDASSQNTEVNVNYQKPRKNESKKKKKEYDASHLNKSRRTMLTEETGGNLRPVFFRNPDHATEEEKKYLYGPFYVSWPKNKAMPPQYAELQKVYHNTHYY